MKGGRGLLAVVCLLPQSVPAQEVSGSIQGRAVTPHAEPVAEVRITIAGPSLQGTRTSQTDLQGFFQMLALPAGSYTVRLARIGHRPVVVDSVPVRIGSSSNLGLVTMESQALKMGRPRWLLSGYRSIRQARRSGPTWMPPLIARCRSLQE